MTEKAGQFNNGYGEVAFQRHCLPLRSLPVPGAGTADLWFLDLAALGNPLVPKHSVDRSDLTVHQQRTLRRFYLRLLLGAYLGIPGKDLKISRQVKGKPHLDRSVHAGVELEFSSASSSACCLIGISCGTPIGVDLEWRGRQAHRPLPLARRYFSEDEYLGLKSFEGQQLHDAFLHTWACKEAVVKAAGHGIANQLCRFSVSVDPALPPAMISIEGDQPEAWRMGVFQPGPDHLGAVTIRHPQLRMQGFTLHPPA